MTIYFVIYYSDIYTLSFNYHLLSTYHHCHSLLALRSHLFINDKSHSMVREDTDKVSDIWGYGGYINNRLELSWSWLEQQTIQAVRHVQFIYPHQQNIKASSTQSPQYLAFINRPQKPFWSGLKKHCDVQVERIRIAVLQYANG